MTAIEIQNEYLDLPPSVAFQIVSNSPYFNNDQIDGEYSLPINLPITDKNYRLLNFTGNHYKTHAKQTIPANLHADGGVVYQGILVVLGFTKNNNRNNSQVCTCIFTFGISSFWQLVQNKNMTNLKFGGPQVYNWTTSNPSDGSNGFWQNMNARLPEGASTDYTFPFIYNGGYVGDATVPPFHSGFVSFMNSAGADGLAFATPNNIALCPAMFLTFIMKAIFTENGWTVDGDFFTDAFYTKIILPSFRSIYWTSETGTFNAPLVKSPLSVITIYLNEHVSPISISTFMIEIKNFYGLAYKFDSQKKNCTITAIKNVPTGVPKDLSSYCLSTWKSTLSNGPKIYGLQSENGADSFAIRISVAGFNILTGVALFSELPDPTLQQPFDTILVWNENAYYQIVQDIVSLEQTWQFFSDNVVDYLPQGLAILPAVLSVNDLPDPTENVVNSVCLVYQKNSYYKIEEDPATSINYWVFLSENYAAYSPGGYTDIISSAVNTLAIRRQATSSDNQSFFPTCSVIGNWWNNLLNLNWGIITILYFGYQYSRNNDGSPTHSTQLPFSSSININNDNTILAPSSNVYQHGCGSEEDGIYFNYWKAWLLNYQSQDYREYSFRLPLYILSQLEWEDVILINSVKFLIQKKSYNLPYDGIVILDLVKLGT